MLLYLIERWTSAPASANAYSFPDMKSKQISSMDDCWRNHWTYIKIASIKYAISDPVEHVVLPSALEENIESWRIGVLHTRVENSRIAEREYWNQELYDSNHPCFLVNFNPLKSRSLFFENWIVHWTIAMNIQSNISRVPEWRFIAHHQIHIPHQFFQPATAAVE